MSWIKLDDQFSINDKVLAAGKDARELYISALCHVGRNLTDGFIDGRMVRQLAAIFEVYDWQAAVESLLDVNLWTEVEGGYAVTGYLKYNPAGHSVKAKRADAAERQRLWREEHRGDDGTYTADNGQRDEDEADEESNAVSNAVTDDEVTTAPRTRPRPRSEYPVPDPVVVEERAEARATTTTTNDPVSAQFYQGLAGIGALVTSRAQADAYDEIVADIRNVADPPAFIEQLMSEAAATTSGRVTPRWFEVVVDRCIREGRMPGDKRSNGKGRDATPVRYAGPNVDWDQVQAEIEGTAGGGNGP